jgi:Bacterial regulatory proteins, luxR family
MPGDRASRTSGSGGGTGGVGYLLKNRVADVRELVEALTRVAAGGTALDPEVVTQLLGASRRNDGLAALTARERDVLALMAEGRSNAATAGILVVSERSVESTSGTSSADSAWRRRTPTTAGCSPCSATCSPDRRHRRHQSQQPARPLAFAGSGCGWRWCSFPNGLRLSAGSGAAVALADDLDVLRLGSLLALRDVELDLLPFLETAVTAACDRAEVHEHIWATLDLDETVALVAVEPLHRALRHLDLLCSGCGDRHGDGGPTPLTIALASLSRHARESIFSHPGYRATGQPRSAIRLFGPRLSGDKVSARGCRYAADARQGT